MGAMEPIWNTMTGGSGQQAPMGTSPGAASPGTAGPPSGQPFPGYPGQPGQPQQSFLSTLREKIFYNHRKYFILGYLVLIFTVLPVADSIWFLCFFTTLLSAYFFIKGFALRNVLILHHQNMNSEAMNSGDSVPLGRPAPGMVPYPPQARVPGEEGQTEQVGNEPRYTQSGELVRPPRAREIIPEAAPVIIADEDKARVPLGRIASDPQNEGIEPEMTENMDPAWEVDDGDFIPTGVPSTRITVARSLDPFGSRHGEFFPVGPLQFERYMLLFVLGNVFFFGSVFALRMGGDAFGVFTLISLLLLGASVLDKWMYGVKLYPVYKDMVRKGLIYDEVNGKVGPAHQWFEKYYKKDNEDILYSDCSTLSNWRPHSYALTTKGIYLEERTGLFAGKSFLYIPLLSLKGMKLETSAINKKYIFGMVTSLLWIFLFQLGPSDPFFYLMLVYLIVQFYQALSRGGGRIQGRALNLTFELSREEHRELMQTRMLDIDSARKRRMFDPDAQEELRSYAWMDKFPPTPSLREVKKSVRSSFTGLIFPTFLYTTIKVAQIFDADVGGMIVLVMLFGLLALMRMFSAASNVWKYQKYLDRPKKGSIDLGFMKLSVPELFMILGYALLLWGIGNAIFSDFLPLAYAPAFIGGILIITGRYFFNSTFHGIDYLEKGNYNPLYHSSVHHRYFTDNKRLIVPIVWFVILLILVGSTRPYFGQTHAELPAQFLDANKGNGWEYLEEEDIDLVGYMGMFSLSIRVYEDDGEDANGDYDGYPAVLSVMTMKFPGIPSEEEMLDQMRKFMTEFNEDQNVKLDEPPEEGTNVTAQGYVYQYFIYNGTGENGTSSFSKGEELRYIVTAYKIDEEKAFVITIGIAKVSDGRLVDIILPPPLPPIPNPTDTRDMQNWDELRHVLIPNVRIG